MRSKVRPVRTVRDEGGGSRGVAGRKAPCERIPDGCPMAWSRREGDTLRIPQDQPGAWSFVAARIRTDPLLGFAHANRRSGKIGNAKLGPDRAWKVGVDVTDVRRWKAVSRARRGIE